LDLLSFKKRTFSSKKGSNLKKDLACESNQLPLKGAACEACKVHGNPAFGIILHD
jgi:hypothetical protein